MTVRMESIMSSGGSKDKPTSLDKDADDDANGHYFSLLAVPAAAQEREEDREEEKPGCALEEEQIVSTQETKQEESNTGSVAMVATASESYETEDQDEDVSVLYSILERQAIRVSERPCTYFWCALLISLVLSVSGMLIGDFAVSVDMTGWYSRGTTIADRQVQFLLVYLNRHKLFRDKTGAVWDDLIHNVQPGWETNDVDFDWRRLVVAPPTTTAPATQFQPLVQSGFEPDWYIAETSSPGRGPPFAMTPTLERRLQDASGSSLLQGCDLSWYYLDMIKSTRLWPIWQPKDVSEPNVLLRQDVFRDLCLSEQQTQQILVDQGLCFGCSDDSKCLPPYSIVFFARLTVSNGLELNCEQLAAAWEELNSRDKQIEQHLVQCARDMEESYIPSDDGNELPDSCPAFFSPVLIDESYDDTAVVHYTSSIFATYWDDVDALYDISNTFDRGTNLIEGAYDTQWEDFVYILIDESLMRDMGLAVGSAFLTLIAMLVHTRSPFLSAIGLLQIVISFPLAFFLYTFVAQLEFFPFLNFIGIFILFALGADDVFVVVDKWRNARIERGEEASTAEVASIALPDAAGAMFLTTLTTAVAFFGTAICPVAPMRCFAVFVGILVLCDYIMCVALVFPALCIYDKSRHRNNCCCRCHSCRSTEQSSIVDMEDSGAQKQSLIHQILNRFYGGFHTIRFFLLLLCVVALILCGITAASMDLPTSADVRLLREDNQYEKNYQWRQNILFDVLSKKNGNSAFVMWGAVPADTGDHNSPDSFSQLVLDDRFEPAKQDGQVYLRDFCDRFFANEFAQPWSDEKCPINKFDEWLQEQASSDSPDQIYVDHCGGATSLPVSESDFDACIYNWGQQGGEKSILARNGKVEIIYIKFDSRVRYDSPHDELEREWNGIEDWITNEKRSVAPTSVSAMFFTSKDFWWYDTTSSLLVTAFVSAVIAMTVGGAVILLSSRSLVLTVFSTLTIAYVLASATATLVALGWTLGFLESICFAIMIGVSCDFVIHFSHAYATPPGRLNNHERTKHALIHMGPSILAAAFTTIAAATVMLFTTISFFVKFAAILFTTILQATIGSFIVFLVLVDCFGPSEPTYLMDRVAKGTCKKEDTAGEGVST